MSEEKNMIPPSAAVAESPRQAKPKARLSEVFDLSDADTDTGGETENEPYSGSDTDVLNDEEHHTGEQTLREEPHSDGAPHTQPKIEGDLQIHSILECGCEVMTCQFSDDGTLLAVGLSDGTIKVYNPESGELVQTLRDRMSVLSKLPVTCLRFFLSPQSQSLLLATYASGRVRCWYLWGGETVWEVKESGIGGGGDEVIQRQTLSLSISPFGEQAVTGGSDSAIHLYDLTTHQRLQICQASSTRTVMDGHRLRVFAVTFHPENEREFISGGWDNTIQFWDTRQQRSVRMLSGPHVCGDAIQIDPVANQILSGSWRKENTLEVWDYCSGQKVSEVLPDRLGHTKIYTCHWLGENHMVAGGSQSNIVKVIDRNSLTMESRLFGLSSAVFSSSVCPAGKLVGLVAASSGYKVYLLDRGQRVKKHVI